MFPAAQAERNLMQYGKTLLNFLPEQTTALLKKLCTEGGTVSAGASRRVESPARMAPLPNAARAPPAPVAPTPPRQLPSGRCRTTPRRC